MTHQPSHTRSGVIGALAAAACMLAAQPASASSFIVLGEPTASPSVITFGAPAPGGTAVAALPPDGIQTAAMPKIITDDMPVETDPGAPDPTGLDVDNVPTVVTNSVIQYEGLVRESLAGNAVAPIQGGVAPTVIRGGLVEEEGSPVVYPLPPQGASPPPVADQPERRLPRHVRRKLEREMRNAPAEAALPPAPVARPTSSAMR